MIPISRPKTGPEELAAIKEVFDSGWLGLGKTVFDFEKELADFLGAKHVIAVNTGTSALHLALDAAGVGPGDEVILPSITFAAAVQPILTLGAIPVFCESCEEDLWMDVEDAKKRITPKTKAFFPVHFCGSTGDLDALYTLARQKNLRVIEDAAHALGSSHDGRMIGSFGDLVCFSFDPIKNITTGEGGAIVLQDAELAEEIRRKRILGIDKDTWHRYKNTRSWFYEVTTNGYRYHMPNFCAAVGLEQMKKLPGFIARRREIAKRYDEAFSGLSGVTTLKFDYEETVPHIYIVRVEAERRDAFMDHLKENGVGTGIHYIANHIHPFFRPHVKEAPVRAEKLWKQIVTIPLHCKLTDEDIESVIGAVKSFESAGVAFMTKTQKKPVPRFVTETEKKLMPRFIATHPKIKTKNVEGSQTGWLVPVFNATEGLIDEAQHPQQVYLTVVAPGQVKGPHLHLKRWGLFTCIKGNARIVTRTEEGYQEFFTGEDQDFATIQVPAGIPAALQNIGEGEAWFLNMPAPAWCPDDQDDHDVAYEDFDFTWPKPKP